jgi:16S rRNA (guanine966-N2)-methyltransferase
MRVIAGSAGSIRFRAVPRGVRPTTDRVRGAIFSSLGKTVVGARVLDLFAGVGTLGIEALSRGATSAVLVERTMHCSKCIRRNLIRTKLSAVIQTVDAFRFINFRTESNSFDLIFADPPYARCAIDEKDLASQLCNSQSLVQAISPRGIFVLEAFREFHLPKNCSWVLLQEKRLNETAIFFLTKPK